MKKFGFSLAEALIGLVIIGVVTALTIPALMSNNSRNAWAKTLSVAVTDFETAMRVMIENDDAIDLFSTRAWRELDPATLVLQGDDADRFKGNIGKFLTISNSMPGNTYSAREMTPKSINSDTFAALPLLMAIGSHAFVTPKGVLYMVKPVGTKDDKGITEDDLIDNGVGLRYSAGLITIDVNGVKPPNRIGHDMFYFVLGSDGVLYPYGSKDVEYYTDRRVADWNSDNARYKCIKNGDTLTVGSGGMGCTARLIGNNYKVDY